MMYQSRKVNSLTSKRFPGVQTIPTTVASGPVKTPAVLIAVKFPTGEGFHYDTVVTMTERQARTLRNKIHTALEAHSKGVATNEVRHTSHS